MAECVASPLSVKLCMQRGPVRERVFSFQTKSLKTSHRKYSRTGCKLVQFSTWKMFELGTFGSTDLEISPRPRATPLRSIGLGALVDFDGATASDLVPVVDQVLLMASIFLTYMAGVIPVEKSYASGQKIISDKNMVPERSDNSGSAVKNNYQLDSNYVLNVVREKLLSSLNALEHEAYPRDRIRQSAKRPLSLNAVAEGPKLRLLWAAFRQVEEEVNNISSFSQPVIKDDWLRVFSEVIQRSCRFICVAWLEKEFSLGKSSEKELASLILERIKGDSTVVQNIKKSGKIDLYTELLCYLTCGSLREDCCYDSSLFSLHGISILEDLVIALADGVASMYLEFISVDSDVLSETNELDLSLCTFSTRELQKLRNEVALNQWLYDNMDTVVSMYEDRFDLCTLQSQPIDLPGNSQNENQGWWKRLIQRKSKTSSSKLHCIVLISSFFMPVKRTKELRALTGWRYYFSLYLELSDIAMPLIRAVINKVSEAISFFLVCLIGRSLGLIYTGIRQSLKWK